MVVVEINKILTEQNGKKQIKKIKYARFQSSASV